MDLANYNVYYILPHTSEWWYNGMNTHIQTVTQMLLNSN